jgi:pyruvate/2-oxoglutarate dehydrogenase complex dihydrolipoamide acyltransferase (E2) component
MKFIKLESRGGNYLVVAENVAWLRTAENGQTSVGIIGGQPLLVVGTVEEVAAKILAEAAPDETSAAEPAPAPPPPPEQAREQEAAQPAPEPAAVRPAADIPPPRPAPTPSERPAPTPRQAISLSERIAAAAAAPKVKPGTQRFMGQLD